MFAYSRLIVNAFKHKIQVNRALFTMESRTKLPRKAREDSKQRLLEETSEQTTKKKTVAPKAVKRAVSEDRLTGVSKTAKTNGKADEHEQTLKVAEKKTVNATKTNGKVKRRSKSAEPQTSKQPISKKRIAKAPAIDEQAEPPAKKERGKKAVVAAKQSSIESLSDSESDVGTKPKKDMAMKVDEEKPSRKRRSQSAEPYSRNVSKPKVTKSVAVDKSTKKSARGEKAVLSKGQSSVESEHDDAEAPSKSNGSKSRRNVTLPAAAQKEVTTTKKGRGKTTVAKFLSDEEEEGEEGEIEEPAPKKGRSTKAVITKPEQKKKTTNKEKVDEEQSTSSKLLNDVSTDYGKIDFGIKEKFNFKITTWNVAGLRALANKNPDYFLKEDADVICMNELKVGSEKEVPEVFKLEGYHSYWNVGKGAGGVALLSKVKPIAVTMDIPDSDFNDEKRLITAEFQKFYLISVYVVNSGRGLKTLDKRLEWNETFDNYVKMLDKKKPVVIAGDMNVSHEEIDLANPKPNKKNAGFTQEERDGFSTLLSHGFVDTFRHFQPDATGAYTFWSYMSKARPKNVGWRLDYFVVSKRFMNHVKNNVIRSSILGSDHCPIVLFLNL